MTTTSLTLRLLRDSGYAAAVVEKWLPKINRRADLWRFGDVLGVHPVRRDFLIVQCTSLANIASRLIKAKQQPELAAWLAAGGRFEVHGWRGGDVKIVEVRGDDLDTVVVARPGRKVRGDWKPVALFGNEAR